MRARDEALIKKQREERAADEATRLQQARLRKNILAGVGEMGENVMSYLQSPGFQSQLKARREAKEAGKAAKAQAFRDSMSRQQGQAEKAIQDTEQIVTQPFSASSMQAPELDYSLSRAGAPAMTAQQKSLGRTFEGILGDVAGGYEGRRKVLLDSPDYTPWGAEAQQANTAAFVDNIVNKAGADAENKFRRNLQTQRMLQEQAFIPMGSLNLEGTK